MIIDLLENLIFNERNNFLSLLEEDLKTIAYE
jgi:hypothetical protein